MSSSDALGSVIAEFLQAIEQGQSPDRTQLLAAHPDQADELTAFFADYDRMNQMAAPLHMSDPNVTAGLDEIVESLLPTIRYFGDYELESEIARGGMGIVYKAKQASRNRHVALKMILTGALAGRDAVQRFRTEAEAAANLDHPNIVPIYEVGEHDHQQYFSMRLINGPSLAIQLQSGAWEPRKAARFIAVVARAVHYAHQRGLLHRDLKPANILIDADGTPYVTDFGLAKRTTGADTELTQTGAIVGTPKYMAPEQAASSKVLTTGIDVYSLGAILFEMLTGRTPFVGERVLDLLDQVRHSEAPRLRSLNTKIDRDLETIVAKCLHKDPARRYESASALADDLERYLAYQPITARRIGTGERMLKWAQRNPAVAMLSLMLVISFALGSLLTFRQMMIAERINLDLLASAKKEADARDKAVLAHRLAEQRLYSSQIQLASSAWDQIQIGQMNRALEDADVQQRGWEWHHLHQSTNTSQRTIEPGSEAGNMLQWSADGKSLGWCDSEGIYVMPLSDEKSLGRQSCWSGWSRSAGDPIPYASFTANLDFVAFYKSNGLFLARPTDKEPTQLGLPRKAGTHAYMGAVTFSVDGFRIYCAAEHQLSCWDRETQEELWSFPIETDQAWAVAVSADETRAAVGFPDDKTTRIFDLSTKTEVFRTTPHLNQPDVALFTPDGKRLITHCAFRNPRVWDIANRKQLLQNNEYWASAVAISRDSKLGVMGMSNGDVVLFDVETGKDHRTLRGHNGHLNAVAISPDGTLVASGGRDKVIKVWDVKKARLLRTLVGHTNAVGTLAFSPDGKTLASGGGERTIKLWEMDAVLPTQQLELPLNGEVVGWKFQRDNRHLLICGWWFDNKGTRGLLDVWDLDKGRVERTIGPHGEDIVGFGLSDNEKWVVTGSSEGTVKLWEFETGHEVRQHFEPLPQGRRFIDSAVITTAAMNPTGTSYAAGRGDGKLFVWNRADGKLLWEAERRTPLDWGSFQRSDNTEVLMKVRSLRYTPDGRYLVSLARISARIVTIYDAGSGKKVFESALLENDATFTISPDGRWLAFGSTGSGEVHLYDLREGGEARSLGRYPRVWSLAFSHDGERLAISRTGEGWTDPMIIILNVESGREVVTMRGHESVVGDLAWLPDDSRLMSGSWDHTVKVWDPVRGQELLSLQMGPRTNERVEHILISPDGTRLLATDGFPDVSGGRRETVLVWRSLRKK